MSVIDYQIGTIGQSGVLPRWVYIQTNDTYGTVNDTPGYLNQIVSEGASFTTKDMALVTCTDYPIVIFNVTYSNGNWGLEEY